MAVLRRDANGETADTLSRWWISETCFLVCFNPDPAPNMVGAEHGACTVQYGRRRYAARAGRFRFFHDASRPIRPSANALWL